MPTFEYGSAIPTTEGAILLPVPFVSWFNDSVVSALAEMTSGENWRGDNIDKIEDAKAYASEMIAKMQILNFNPIPLAKIEAFALQTAPDGWLPCDGATYTEDEYPELYAAIDPTFKDTD